jgi:hypothetical protein
MKTKIEISNLIGDDAINFECSIKQIEFIRDLMSKRKMDDLFQKYFTVNGKIIRNHLTKINAGRLIKTLLVYGSQIEFKEYQSIPLKEKKIKKLYMPNAKFNSGHKISMEEQEQLLNKYENEKCVDLLFKLKL